MRELIERNKAIESKAKAALIQSKKDYKWAMDNDCRNMKIAAAAKMKVLTELLEG